MCRLAPRFSVGFLVLFVSLASSTWEFPSSSDGTATLATAVSLAEHGTLAIDARFLTDNAYAPSAKQGGNGRAYSKYGLGLSLVELPLVVLARGTSQMFGFSQSGVQTALLSLLNPLATALAAALLFAMCERLGASRTAARLAALAYAFATLAWASAISDNSDALQAFLVTLAAWGLAGGGGDRPNRALWVSGASLGWGVLTKTSIAVLAPPFVVGAWLVCRSRGMSWRDALAGSARVAAPVAAGILALAWLNWTRFGSMTTTGYNTPVLTHPLWSGLYGLLLGPNKGVVFYAPLVLLAPLGLVALWRRSISLAAALILSVIVWTPLNAIFYQWGGGWCWGPRYLLPILPFSFVAIGMTFDRPTAGLIARALCTAGFMINLLGVVVSEDAYRRTTMHVWLPDRTGYVTMGDATTPGRIVDYPRSAEDVLPAFSSIAGHWWLVRVALAGCDCTEESAECRCRTGRFEENRLFLSPPWRAQFGDAVPRPPYGIGIVQPLLLRERYRQAVVDPNRERQ